MKKNFVILLAVVMVCLFRFFTALQTEFHLGGFSPLMALAFVGGWIWKDSRPLSLLLFASLFITDLGLNIIQGYPGFHPFMIVTLICYTAAFQIGSRLENCSSLNQLIGLIGSSVGFYMITNSFTWMGSTQYPQTFQGWIQSWTLGLPGYPPAYTFLRNALVSDLLFWGILKLAFISIPEKSTEKSTLYAAV